MNVLVDDLIHMGQQDLAALGYDRGNMGSEATTQAVVSIPRFQTEHDLLVTGEITPQLAAVIGSSRAGQPQELGSAAPASQCPNALQAIQRACT